MKEKSIALVSLDAIEDCIYLIRGQKVMLDRDLAALYQAPAGRLNEQVRRNLKRFPSDFMFQLTTEEALYLRSQFAILGARGRGRHSKYRPRVFTEQGVAMLSGVLHSDRAIEVNVAIMRAFARMRRILSSNEELSGKLEELETKLIAHDYQIEDILKAIRKLMREPQKRKLKIGYLAGTDRTPHGSMNFYNKGNL